MKYFTWIIICLCSAMCFMSCTENGTWRPKGARTEIGAIPEKHTLPLTDLVESWNQRRKGVERIRLRGTVHAIWQQTDADGDVSHHNESGDTLIMYRDPSSLMVTLDKLGKSYIVGGCDEQQWWLLDQLAEPTTLYHGEREGVGSRVLGLPLDPEHLPMLLGLQRMKPKEDWKLSWITRYDQDGSIVMQGYFLETATFRMVIAPKSLLPLRVDLLDAKGYTRIIATLSDVISGQGDDNIWFVMREHVLIQPVDRKAKLDIKLLSLVAKNKKVPDGVFDLQRLKDSYSPEKTVDVDAQ